MNRYLDLGGNYIETARWYGDGHSEKKIGVTVSHRRDEFIIATKTENRDKSTYTKNLDASLKNLKTDHIDLHIIHAIGYKYPDGGNRFDDLKEALAPEGALEGAQEAVKKGKVRFVGVSCMGSLMYS